MSSKKTIGKYNIIKEIGVGSFSRVYYAKDQEQNEYAIKKIPRNQDQPELNKQIEKEIEILLKLDNPNIIKLQDIKQTKNNIYIVFQYCQYGDLRVCQNQYFKKGMPEIIVQKIIQQLVTAMRGMRDIGIVHRDLKLGNILIQKNFEILLADFGFAKIQQEFFMNSYCGTPITMAPEILKRQNYDAKCDIWSIGVIAYQLLFGVPPFMPSKGNWETNLLYEIENKKMNYESLELLSQNGKDFLKKCLTIEPSKRINYDELFEHSYITENLNSYNEQIEEIFQDYCSRQLEQKRKQKQSFAQSSLTQDFIQNVKNEQNQKKQEDLEESNVELLYKDTDLIKQYFEQIPDQKLNLFLAKQCFIQSQEDFFQPTKVQMKNQFTTIKENIENDQYLLDQYSNDIQLALRCLQQNLKCLIQNVDLKIYLEQNHLFDLPINQFAKTQFQALIKEIESYIQQLNLQMDQNYLNTNKSLVQNLKCQLQKKIQGLKNNQKINNQSELRKLIKEYEFLRNLWIIAEQSHLNPKYELKIKNLRGESFITQKLKQALQENITRQLYLSQQENISDQSELDKQNEEQNSNDSQKEKKQQQQDDEEEFQKLQNIEELDIIKVTSDNQSQYNDTHYPQNISQYFSHKDISIILITLNDKIQDLNYQLEQDYQ